MNASIFQQRNIIQNNLTSHDTIKQWFYTVINFIPCDKKHCQFELV